MLAYYNHFVVDILFIILFCDKSNLFLNQTKLSISAINIKSQKIARDLLREGERERNKKRKIIPVLLTQSLIICNKEWGDITVGKYRTITKQKS